jgi:hypothetical protein
LVVSCHTWLVGGHRRCIMCLIQLLCSRRALVGCGHDSWDEDWHLRLFASFLGVAMLGGREVDLGRNLDRGSKGTKQSRTVQPGRCLRSYPTLPSSSLHSGQAHPCRSAGYSLTKPARGRRDPASSPVTTPTQGGLSRDQTQRNYVVLRSSHKRANSPFQSHTTHHAFPRSVWSTRLLSSPTPSGPRPTLGSASYGPPRDTKPPSRFEKRARLGLPVAVTPGGGTGGGVRRAI